MCAPIPTRAYAFKRSQTGAPIGALLSPAPLEGRHCTGSPLAIAESHGSPETERSAGDGRAAAGWTAWPAPFVPESQAPGTKTCHGIPS
jgi:hypothetical protein